MDDGKLTQFLHKLLDHVGAGGLHSDVDALTKDDASEEKGEEDTTNA